MALIDKASLLMVPSTYEAGKLYNVLPSGNRAPDKTGSNSGYDQTRADFDFDRGSNAAATRIGSDGLIKKYRENLLVQSNQFDTNWNLYLGTLTSGQSGYDGSSDAWLLEATDVLCNVQQDVSQSGIHTLSVYAKAGTQGGVFLRLDGGSNPRCFFNLTDGLVGSASGTPIHTSIEDVGGGWYRCSMSVNSSTTTAKIYLANDSNGFSASGSIYIQNAQLESGMVSTDYLESTSVTGKAGVLIDLPRIDYSSGAGALLLEPQRANLVPYSEYFDGWSKISATLEANATTSPEGVVNAYKHTRAGNNSVLYFGGLSSATTNTFSVFVKNEDADIVRVGLTEVGVADYECFVNLTTGTITSTTSGATSDIEDYGNGWYRVHITLTSSAAVNTYFAIPDTQSGSVYWYGAQLEAGSYATSYIPNHGESGGVTRAADSCLGAASDTAFNINEGVVFAEFSAFYDDGTFRQMGIAGSTGNEVNLSFDSTSNRIGGIVRSGGTYYVLSHVVSDTTINTKAALKYKVNDIALYVDGVEVDSLSSAVMPTSLNEFNFAIGTTNSNVFYGNVKQVAVFNEALSDSELETLTTL